MPMLFMASSAGNERAYVKFEELFGLKSPFQKQF